jgi:hypothetical protein
MYVYSTHDGGGRHKIQIGPVWINSPLVMQERYDRSTQQCVNHFSRSFMHTTDML